MKKVTILILAIFAITLFAHGVEARARYGSHRVGGYNSHGKGSHYIGGYVRSGPALRHR